MLFFVETRICQSPALSRFGQEVPRLRQYRQGLLQQLLHQILKWFFPFIQKDRQSVDSSDLPELEQMPLPLLTV